LLRDLHDSNPIAVVIIIIILLIKQLSSVHLILAVMILFVIIHSVISLLALDFKPEYWLSYYCYQIVVITRVTATTLQCTSAFRRPYAAPIAFSIAVQLAITIQITKTMLLVG